MKGVERVLMMQEQASHGLGQSPEDADSMSIQRAEIAFCKVCMFCFAVGLGSKV